MDIPHIHPDTIEEVRQGVDIVEVISEYVVLRQRGKDYLGLCPFHNEKTPSFSVSSQKQLYYCFGCGTGGNTFKFLMEIGQQSFAEVVLDLARRYQIPVKTLEPQQRQEIQRQLSLKEQLYEIVAVAASFYEHTLRQPQGETALAYLRSTRVLDDLTISQFQLGYAPCGWETLYRYLVEQKRYPVNLVEQAGLIKKRKSGNGFYDVFRDRVIIPIADSQGRLIGFGSRTISAEDQPKYLNSPETPLFDKSKTLYALDRARSSISKEDRAIVVEGYFDAIALHTVGIKNAVASLGTAFTAYQLKQLIRYTPSKQVILNFDADNAGTKATERAIREIEDLVYSGVVQLRILNLPDGKDADEYLRTHHLGSPQVLEMSVHSSDKAVELYQKSLDNAPLWLDWQIQQLLAEHTLKTPDGLNHIARGMVKLLNRIQDANQRNYYLDYCAELLSQRDNRLIEKNVATLKAQLSPKTSRKVNKNKTKQKKSSFSFYQGKSTNSSNISPSDTSLLAEEGTELPLVTKEVEKLETSSKVSSQKSNQGKLSLPSASSQTNSSSILIAVSPETELLEQTESLLLRIYIHCPRYRKDIIENLEEKDLLFSLPLHRFLWQKIVESEATITQNSGEDNNPLLKELQNRILYFPEMMGQVNQFLYLNETTQADLSRTFTLIENAIASLELVECEKYKLYCTKQIQNQDPRTDAKYQYYCQELQETEKKIKELEKKRLYTQNSTYLS